MVYVDLSSTQWTGAQRLYWRETVTPPLAVVSLIVCVAAGIIYYIFPRLREFPRSILSWINNYNIIFSVYIIAKWFPSSVFHDTMVVHLKSGSPSCRLALFLDNFTLSGLVACDTLIVVTLFLVVKMGIDLDIHKDRFFKVYLAFAVFYPLTVGLAAGFAFDTSTDVGSPCVVRSAFGQGILTYPSVVLLAVQVILLVWAMVYVREVFGAVHSTNHTQFPVKYLIVRFLATFFAQLYNILGVQMYLLFPHTQKNAIWARFIFASHANGGTIDALVLILGNVDFMNWLKEQFVKYWPSRTRQFDVDVENVQAPLPVCITESTIELPSVIFENAPTRKASAPYEEDIRVSPTSTPNTSSKLAIISHEPVVNL